MSRAALFEGEVVAPVAVPVAEPLAELEDDPELDPEPDCGDPSPLVWLALTLDESGKAVTPVPLAQELGSIWTVGDEVKVKSAHCGRASGARSTLTPRTEYLQYKDHRLLPHQ